MGEELNEIGELSFPLIGTSGFDLKERNTI